MTSSPAPLTLLDKELHSALMNDTLSWMSRTEIAKALGLKALSTYQISRLERLVTLGYVEKDERKTGTAKINFVYRIQDLKS